MFGNIIVIMRVTTAVPTLEDAIPVLAQVRRKYSIYNFPCGYEIILIKIKECFSNSLERRLQGVLFSDINAVNKIE
jgi:hypothetical protein